MMSTTSVISKVPYKLNGSGSHCRWLENWFAAWGAWHPPPHRQFISHTQETKRCKIMEYHWCRSLVIRIKYLKMYLILWFPTYPFPRSQSVLNLLNFFPSVHNLFTCFTQFCEMYTVQIWHFHSTHFCIEMASIAGDHDETCSFTHSLSLA